MIFEIDPPTPRGGDTSSVLTRLNLIMTIIHHTSLRLTSCRTTRTNVNANSKDKIMVTLRMTWYHWSDIYVLLHDLDVISAQDVTSKHRCLQIL